MDLLPPTDPPPGKLPADDPVTPDPAVDTDEPAAPGPTPPAMSPDAVFPEAASPDGDDGSVTPTTARPPGRSAVTARGEPERRGADRRRRPTPMFSRYWFTGRRRGGRRQGETDEIYVDRHTPYEWFLAVGVLVLSVLDMVLTLAYLDAGGEEANPVMQLALEGGEGVFAGVKIGVTLVGALFLLVHSRFRKGRRGLELLFLLYSLLFCYHLWLRAQYGA